MAENRTRPVSRVKPATVFSTVAIGAVTASVTVVGGPALAADYPSWSDIEQAKQNEQTKQAEIAKLGDLLAQLRQTADAAVETSAIAAEKYRNTVIARDEAADREERLAKKADEADAVAELSRMRAGLIAAHLAKTAGTDLGAELAFSGDADGLLKQLGLASKIGEQSKSIADRATADRNTAESLRAQAERAKAERERLAKAAEEQADVARQAADAALAAVSEQEQRSQELYAQLAALKDTTAELERERDAGIAQEAAEAAARKAEADRLAAEEAASHANNGGNGNGGGSGGGASPNPAPAPPDAGAVETAIWYASQQLGKPYSLGGAGPDVWDCSGLTLKAYGYAGISIGTHSATNQYRTLANRGKAVSLRDIQRGDLLFWGGGGDYYHVAIYLGGGQILEAPDYGKPVRIWPIWGSPSAAARPAS
ncbi:NlpC/P60 family protein [Agromyces protaetiae]|uniref:NlpC/P60 family protein n=1 Tax=Agromyces protaetiae TaxID=2509455 RepID=A0A4P6FGT2_9MICO|nr:C40 family peptidase [Agromyces protaetiae]QAY73077.1 NlpC/P60 family protein [Agromyces protaetiae]